MRNQPPIGAPNRTHSGSSGQLRLLQGASIGLALVAYRDLLPLHPSTKFEYAIHFWFFEPSYTWPPLLLAAALWLAVRRSRRLTKAPPRRGSPLPAALLLAVGMGLFAWARLTGATDLLIPSLMANLLGVAALFKGASGCRAIALPTLFLLFALPLPAPLLNQVVWQFQLWTASATSGLLNAVGFSAVVEGLLISRPEHLFLVIENCSGVRVVEIFTAGAILLREFSQAKGWRSWAPVLVAPFLALILNVLRAGVVAASQNPAALNDHRIQGVILLVVGGGVLALLTRSLSPRRPEKEPETPPPGTNASDTTFWGSITAGTVSLVVISLMLSPWPDAAPPADLERRIPITHAGWTGTRLTLPLQFLGRVRFGSAIDRHYRRGDDVVALFVGAAQAGDRSSSPFSPKTVLLQAGWQVEGRRDAQATALQRSVGAYVLHSPGGHVAVYHWNLGDLGLPTETARYLLALDATPYAGRRAGAVVRLATPVDSTAQEDLEAGWERLDGFVRDFAALLNAL